MVTIYGELYSSKNTGRIFFNKKTNKPIFGYKKNVKKQEQDFAYQLSSLKKDFMRMKKDKLYPLTIQFKIYRLTHRRFDYLNIIQGLCDSMVKAGWIDDDSAKYLIPAFLPYEKDTENPRTEIVIL